MGSKHREELGPASHGTHRWAGLWLSRCLHLAVLLLQLLDLLQGEEGAAAAGRLLGVPLCPLLEGVGVAALHMQAQVLLVLGGEVTELTSKRLSSCRAQEGEVRQEVPRGWQGEQADSDCLWEKGGCRASIKQLLPPVCLTAMCETRKSSRKVEYLQTLHL